MLLSLRSVVRVRMEIRMGRVSAAPLSAGVACTTACLAGTQGRHTSSAVTSYCRIGKSTRLRLPALPCAAWRCCGCRHCLRLGCSLMREKAAAAVAAAAVAAAAEVTAASNVYQQQRQPLPGRCRVSLYAKGKLVTSGASDAR